VIAGLVTIAAMSAFAGIVWWAMARRNQARFAEAARLPLDDEPPASASSSPRRSRP
jgi:cytochrome c oxidase cbb3-type subunit 4